MAKVAKNERAQLDGQIAMRLADARLRRDSFPINSEHWWYWKGKVEAYKKVREIVFSVWKS